MLFNSLYIVFALFRNKFWSNDKIFNRLLAFSRMWIRFLGIWLHLHVIVPQCDLFDQVLLLMCLSCICLLAMHTLICVTVSVPPDIRGWLRLLLVALPGLFCLPF